MIFLVFWGFFQIPWVFFFHFPGFHDFSRGWKPCQTVYSVLESHTTSSWVSCLLWSPVTIVTISSGWDSTTTLASEATVVWIVSFSPLSGVTKSSETIGSKYTNHAKGRLQKLQAKVDGPSSLLETLAMYVFDLKQTLLYLRQKCWLFWDWTRTRKRKKNMVKP